MNITRADLIQVAALLIALSALMTWVIRSLNS